MLKQFFFYDREKLVEYSAFALNVVLSNPCVAPRPGVKIFLFLLSICADELMSTLKIMAFLPQSKFGIEKK